ncbi:MAG: transposase [Akkermansiaceae bacterium]
MFLNPYKAIERHQGNLPHWQQEETMLFVTWRLQDSLPKAVVEKIQVRRTRWITTHPQPWDEPTFREYNRLFTLRIEDLLDDCHGSCLLRDPGNSTIVANALLHFHTERYTLDTFVIMPNHVHVLLGPIGENKLGDIIGSWKRFSSREINKARGETGALWQREAWDRLIRSQRHLDWTRQYILKNPSNLPPSSYRLRQRAEEV